MRLQTAPPLQKWLADWQDGGYNTDENVRDTLHPAEEPMGSTVKYLSPFSTAEVVAVGDPDSDQEGRARR